ncbi:MAG: hypothetical protein HUU32_11540 [Calditrichaceae bacterium]|nr:hypothetical protein [Calditrichia bacterium]NUQ42020.1 hypothetical protein [Calditrichaceae bacterium]
MKKRKHRKPLGSEEEIQLFKELCEAVNRLGIETRVEEGNFRGGMCLVEGEKEILFINKKDSMDKRIALVISELKKRNVSEAQLPESLRAKIVDWF